MKITNIQSKKDTRIGILLYLKNKISIEVEIGKIESGLSTDLTLTSYFQNAPDYQKLLVRLSRQQKVVDALATNEPNSSQHIFEQKKLEKLNQLIIEFKAGTLRLASIFLTLKVRTERLQKARDLFEQGRIGEADRLLLEEDLLGDQESLVAQMHYLQQRKKDVYNLLHETVA